MLYLLIGFILIRGIIFLMPKTRLKELEKKQLIKATAELNNSVDEQNPYLGLREQAFSVTPDQLNLTLDITDDCVFGVVMDWNIGDVILTVVAFQTGDASLYLSSGQAFIGGVEHEKINRAALFLVREAQKYLPMFVLTYTNPLPDKRKVRFCLRTNKGDRTIQENADRLENGTAKCSTLFKLGNDLISEYRLQASENKKGMSHN